MPKTRKIPMRMCVGCREMKPKRELTRVVKPQEGDAHIDLRGKAPGRGAYVCACVECFRKARKSKALERALECSISDEVFSQLEAQIPEIVTEPEETGE